MSALPGAGSISPQLPPILTSILGREREHDQLLGLLEDPRTRLVTLTGPGGVGKTRLALHVATTLIEEFGRDVVYIPLVAIRDPSLVIPTIGQALGVPFDTSATWIDRLVEVLNERSPLLVLDNIEQLLNAAPDLANLVARCPGVTVLVTSQIALGIDGEQRYPLSPLPTPHLFQTTAETIMRSDAVILFVARARATKPGLVVDDRTSGIIAEICRKLDGLPLAIELAAARTNILSIEALLARLSNRLQVLRGERQGVPDRLRTMRHAIAWSYELLSHSEQWLFRRISVFAGGFSLDAVEALCQEAPDPIDAWTVISALVDHSLVQAISQPTADARFQMLETLRDYGLEQLDALGDAAEARLAHATWCLNLAEAAEPRLVGSDQEEWLDRLDLEWDNIRAASNWSFESGHEQVVLRVLGAIWRFCSNRGYTIETRTFLDRALSATSGQQSSHRCRGLVAAGNLAQDQRDLDVAQDLFEQAREIAVSNGHQQDEIQSLIGLAKVAVNRSDYTTAIELHSRAMTLARERGDQRAVGVSLGGLAYVSYFQGKLDDAVHYWEEGRQVVAALGDSLLEAVAAGNLGAVAMVRGEYDRAEQLLSRTLELQRRMRVSDSLPYTLTNLGETWRQLGDYTLAEDLLAEAIARFRDLGYKGSEGTCLTSYAQLARDKGDSARSAMMLIESTRLIHEAGDQFPITENAEVLAELCVDRGTHTTAIELVAAAASIRKHIGSEPKPVQQAHIDELVTVIRQAVPEATYARHWKSGAELDLDSLTRRITIVAREIVGTRQPKPFFPEVEPPEISHKLTNRELEILRLLTQGRSTREISDALFISPRTTTTHIANILGKIDVTSRAAAVAWAMRNGLT